VIHDMSIITGNNITLLASQTVSIPSNFIIRTIGGAPSNDTFDSAENLVLAYIGDIDPANNNYAFTFTVYNSDATSSITMNPGTDVTINPVNPLTTDTIPPGSARIYLCVQTSAVLGVSATVGIYPY